MNKGDIVQALYEKGYGKKASDEVIDDIFQIISEALLRGEKVMLRGFGTFEVKKRRGHNARDPVTEQIRPYDDFHAIVFKPGDPLKDDIKTAMAAG